MTGLHPIGPEIAWQALQFTLLTLASYSLTRFVTTESIFDRQRWWLVRKLNESHGPRDADSKLATLITCPYCSGAYVTLVVFLVAQWHLSVWIPVVQILAARVVVGMLGSRFD